MTVSKVSVLTCATAHTQATPLTAHRTLVWQRAAVASTASRARPVGSIWAHGKLQRMRGKRPPSAVSPHTVTPCAAPQHVEALHASEGEYMSCWAAYPFVWCSGRDCDLKLRARRDSGPWRHALYTPPVLAPTRWPTRLSRDLSLNGDRYGHRMVRRACLSCEARPSA